MAPADCLAGRRSGSGRYVIGGASEEDDAQMNVQGVFIFGLPNPSVVVDSLLHKSVSHLDG